MGQVAQFQPKRMKSRRNPKRFRQPLGVVVAAATGAMLYFALTLTPVEIFIGSSGGFGSCAMAWQRNCVVDGDTIRHDGMTIRIADIDTPEVFSPKCASEAARGRRATQRLIQLINVGPFDIQKIGARDKDRYGRQLRLVMRNGRSLGGQLVAEGLARPWTGKRRSWCG